MRIDGTVYFSPFAIHRVLVDLFQGGRRRVAHAFHRVLVGHIQRQHNGCVIVPKVMKAAFQSELVPDLDEHLGDRIGYMVDDEFAVAGHVPKAFNDEARQSDLALALHRLGLLENDPLPVLVLQHRSANVYRRLLQVDVAEFQSTDL